MLKGKKCLTLSYVPYQSLASLRYRITLESSNQQSYKKKRIKVPCKRGFYVLDIGDTFDREAGRVIL